MKILEKDKRVVLSKVINQDWYADYMEDTDHKEYIPRIIHQIWVGDNPMPHAYREYSETWKHHHPKWKYILWDNNNLNNIKSLDQKVLDKIDNNGAKSDYIRYCALYDMGGLYVDMDFECFKPHDRFLNLRFFTTWIPNPSPNFYMGHIGCEAGHPIVKSLKDDIKGCEGNNSDIIHYTTGPYYFSDKIFRYADKHTSYNKIVGFPVETFYTISHHQRYKYKDRESKLLLRKKLDSYGIHYYGTSWIN